MKNYKLEKLQNGETFVTSERVTRENFQYYDLNSEWVKNHIIEMEKLNVA